MSKEQITLEYIINSSPGILFSRLSTPSGLSEWFADDVDQDQQRFIFKWLDDQQVALELQRKENKMIRFRWEDDSDEDTYFEFLINTDELTGSSALIVTDFCEADERQQTIELWNKQIDLLKHGLGTL
jgi:uncharacterized protein YndB with AHSA1/START domain